MKNKFYILALIPVAFAMTSFNIETQSGRTSLGSLATVTPEEDTGDNQEQENRVTIGQVVDHVEDIFRQMQLTIDLNNNDEDDTRLEITGIESKQASNTSLSSRRTNQDKIILTIKSHTDSNLEAVSGVSCECDAQQSIQLELTPEELGLTDNTDLESLDQDKLKEVLQAKSGVIIEKINQQRRGQHEERLAAKDCSLKENTREQLDCLIDRVKESSGEEKEEFIAQIEDQMENLLYSEERSDQRTFKAIFRRLRGDSAFRNLRAKLEEHRNIKNKIDEYKENSDRIRLANNIKDFNQMYTESEDMMKSIERNGFRYPQDWQNYQLALKNMNYAENMRLGAQRELDTITSSFRGEFDEVARSSSRLSPRDIQIARNYAFPRSPNVGRGNVRGRLSVSQLPGTPPFVGGHLGRTGILGGDIYYNSLQRPSLGRFNGRSSRGRVGHNFTTFDAGRGVRSRGRRNLRYEGTRTLSMPERLYIDRGYPRGRTNIGRGRSI